MVVETPPPEEHSGTWDYRNATGTEGVVRSLRVYSLPYYSANLAAVSARRVE
jgi:hypothetical protein